MAQRGSCPRCGGADPWKINAKVPKGRQTARKGLYQCRACKRQFSVTTGSVFESSHLPLSKWLMAIHLMSASKKGMSAHQLHRMLGCTYRAAWFVMHRLRYAMAHNAGLFSGTVEVDETYIGGKRRVGRYSYEGKGGRPGPKDQVKTAVVALVERKGRAMAFPVDRVDGATLQEAVRARTIPAESDMMTDQWQGYMGFANGFKSHSHIPHDRKIYVRGNVHTNTVEGFFALLKRGIVGTFHHVSKGHLHRYCDEFCVPVFASFGAGRNGRRARGDDRSRRGREAPDLQATIERARRERERLKHGRKWHTGRRRKLRLPFDW